MPENLFLASFREIESKYDFFIILKFKSKKSEENNLVNKNYIISKDNNYDKCWRVLYRDRAITRL